MDAQRRAVRALLRRGDPTAALTLRCGTKCSCRNVSQGDRIAKAIVRPNCRIHDSHVTVPTELQMANRETSAASARTPLSSEELRLMDCWWRACNYLAVGMIYLRANP